MRKRKTTKVAVRARRAFVVFLAEWYAVQTLR
jgi:hypothetical protein